MLAFHPISPVVFVAVDVSTMLSAHFSACAKSGCSLPVLTKHWKHSATLHFTYTSTRHRKRQAASKRKRSRTCQELQDSFAECRTDLAPGTIKAYGNTWELFFKCFSPTAPIETITTEKLVQWLASLRAKYASASIASYFKDIGTHLNWAVRQGWLTKNPL